jgi:hypothetical protein
MRLRPFLGIALLLAGGCVNRNPRPEAPENPKYTFPHSTHVEAGLSCRACHEGITQATAVGPTIHVSLPTGEAAKACLECHEAGPPSLPPRRIERTINFSHAAHLPYVNGQCARCHTALVEPGDVKAPVPPMSVCTACHNHALDYAQAKCQPCHVDLKRYPLKPVADFKHEADFLRTHGAMAKAQVASCAACHEQTSCAECHAAATRPFKPDIQWPEKVGASFIHRGDYVSRHTIDVAADPASCRRCHGSAFCEACHTQQRVSPRATATLGSDPHPPGWSAGAVHGPAARQNIVSCAGCHDEGARSTCVTCHRNVNPHPVGWGQRHNKTSDVASNSMCRTCHTQ